MLVCRGAFCSHAPPRATFQSRARVTVPPKPARVQVGRQFPRGSSAYVLNGWAPAGAVQVSLEVLHERCAVHGAARCGWTLRRPRPARQKGRASGRRTRVWGNRRVGFLRCTAAGAGWRSVCSSCCTAAVRAPVPPRTRRARTQTSEQRVGSQRSTGLGGTADKRCNSAHFRGAASWRPGGKGRIFFNKNKTTSNSLTILPLSNVRLDHGVHVPTQATATQHKSAHGTVSRG